MDPSNLLDRPRCTGTSKRSGKPCKRAPVRGAKVCPTHGGSAPQVRKAAERRLLAQAAEADARAVLAHEGVHQVDDPVLELGKLAGEARALTSALARRVNSLGSLTTADTGGLRVELSLYERSLDRLGRFLEALARLGFEERTVRVTEAIAQQVSTALEGILSDLDLTDEQRYRVPMIVRDHMLKLVEPA